MKSSTDIPDPSRTIPYTDMAEPRRANVRMDIELDIEMKSSNETLLPKRLIPYNETLLPTRAHRRHERLEPICTLSRTEKLEPSLNVP
jgi:hypothetical protein